MQYDTPFASEHAVAEPDFQIRRGQGVDNNRTMINYREIEVIRNGNGDIRRFAVLYHGPTSRGPGTDPVVTALPAEKHHKWFGQGYRPVEWIPPDPPSPRQWLPSMVDDAIAAGEPIPDELAPKGYIGPTFSVADQRKRSPRAKADE